MATAPRPPGSSRPPEPAPLWASGRFTLRVHGVGSNWQRLIEVHRPFALIGRVSGAEVQISDREVSARHVYLHLDRRGLFAVDLASRTGSRIGPLGRSAAWLAPGDVIEVAGRRIELVDLTIDDPDPLGPAPGHDPLSDSGDRPLAHVTLYPTGRDEAPLVLNSELVFLGRSSACGVQVDEPAAARIQCALVRAPEAAYIVDLLGRIAWLNGKPLREAIPLTDGDLLGIGSIRFECRLRPAGDESPASAPRPTLGNAPALIEPAAPTVTELLPDLPTPPLPPELLGSEHQGQILAWMMGVLQATQGEMLRRQDQFQHDLVAVLKQIQSDNASALDKHFEKVDHLNRELSSLRDEIRQRFGPSSAPARPEPPKVPPLRINRPEPTAPEDAEAAAAWLLQRVGRLDHENRNSWKDLLGRLGRGDKKP